MFLIWGILASQILLKKKKKSLLAKSRYLFTELSFGEQKLELLNLIETLSNQQNP